MGMLTGTHFKVVSTWLSYCRPTESALGGTKPISADTGCTMRVCLARVSTWRTSIVKASVLLATYERACIPIWAGSGIAVAPANCVLEAYATDARSFRAPITLITAVAEAVDSI